MRLTNFKNWLLESGGLRSGVELAQDPDRMVRYEVAEHPNTGDDALYLLSKDEDPEVREAALTALRPRQDREMKSWGWDEEAIELIRQLGI